MPSKLRILVDVDVAASGVKSGIGNYTAGMVVALAENYPDVEIVGHYFNFLGRSKPDLPTAKNISYRQSKLLPRKLANLMRRFRIPVPYELLIRGSPDFIIFPNFLIRKTFRKTPYAVTIHDFTYLEHPEFVSKRNQQDLTKLVPIGLKHASMALVLSNTMGEALKKHYPWFKNLVVSNLIPVAIPEHIQATNAHKLLAKLGVTKRYILFIGNIEPRKNITGLVRAYSQLPSELRQSICLVLAGGKGWNDSSIIDAIKLAKSDGADIIETGYVTDKERETLYSEAHTVVLPSFYEGYGIPALESMAYRKPVLLSDIPVLKEIAGDAAIYCDPHDPRDIANKLKIIITNHKVRKTLISNGRQTIESRTWESFASKLMRAINGIIGRDNRQ